MFDTQYGKNLAKGKRIELHPGTNAWIMGDRYGEITKLGTKYVHVRMDSSGRILKLNPDRVRVID